MNFKIYHIPTATNGHLHLFPAPLTKRIANFAREALSEISVDLVVNLLSVEERTQNQFNEQEKVYKQLDIELIHFPIQDYRTPQNKADFGKLVEVLVVKLIKGDNVAIHCYGGIGRSSVLAISVLCQLGINLEEAITTITKHRYHKVPDTNAQLEWLKDFNKR